MPRGRTAFREGERAGGQALDDDMGSGASFSSVTGGTLLRVFP